VRQRGVALDRMEEEKLEFLQKARQGYLEQARNDTRLFKVVDASRPLDHVVGDVLKHVDDLIAAA
jgi:dTMP kinase